MVYYLFKLNPESGVADKLLPYLEKNMGKVDYVPSKRRIVCESVSNADADIIVFLKNNIADSSVIFESHSAEVRLEYQFYGPAQTSTKTFLLPLEAPKAIMNL